MNSLHVSLIQDAPVLFDLEASLNKTAVLSKKAAAGGAQLLLFPEAFLGGYPRGLSFGTTVGSRSKEGRDLWMKYWDACPRVDDYLLGFLGKLATDLGVYLGIGIVEQAPIGSTLYCSFLLFDPSGELIHHHRKIKPTGTERLIWGEGDGSSLHTVPTELGKLSALICWENYMPAARMALYKESMDIHLAPTADSRDSWLASMRHIALEGRCFVLSCNQFVQKDQYPAYCQKELEDFPQIMCRGGSAVISPLGEVLAGPLYNEAGFVEAHLSLDDVVKSRMDFEAFGHYNRPDLFFFEVLKQQNQ